jgi:cytochrome c biogenesis factor
MFNSAMNIFHFLTPFIINLASALIIITLATRRRQRTRHDLDYAHALLVQFREHKHLLIAPIVLVILGVPRLIISFASSCLKSVDDSSIFVAGYFVSFIPSMLTFVLFVLPSKLYKTEFQKFAQRFRRMVRNRIHLDF